MNARSGFAALVLTVLALAGAWALFAAAVAVVIAWWLLRLYRHPWGPCWLCRGARRNPGSDESQWGRCRACGGSGEMVRPGARLVRPGLARRTR